MSAPAGLPWPDPLIIRNLPISPPLVLAPMEGVTDLCFRRMIRRIGGTGLTVTEFVPSEGIIRNVPAVMEMASFDPDEAPVAIQLYGRRPESLAAAARKVEAMGAHLVDINMGCPARKVCAHSGGCALMKEPILVRDIVRTVREATKLPLTVKMRSGNTAESRNAPEIAWICQEEGADAVTIHWRTRDDGFTGIRDVNTIRAVRERLSIPVIGNGDILDVASARAMIEDTGCHGLMIGRGAARDPWVFRRVQAWLRGEPEPVVTPAMRGAFLVDYARTVEATFRTDSAALGRVKMMVGYNARGIPGAARFRTDVLHANSMAEFFRIAEAFFGGQQG